MKNYIAVLAVFGSVAYAANVSDVKVRALDGFGGDLGSVLARCQTRAGSEYDAVTVSRDVAALNATKEFQEINADARRLEDGSIEVVYYVKRKMRFVAPLSVEGNSYFGVSKIAKESGLKDGGLYSEGDLAAAAGKVRALYQKRHFPDVKVTPVPTMLGDGNACSIRFLVEEGARQQVSGFVFEGTDPEEHDELCAAIGDFPWWNPRGWFADSPVSDDQLAQAVSKIKAYYADRGYLDVTVADPVRRPVEGREGSEVVYKVGKGPCYRINSMKIEGLTRYPEPVVREKSALPETGSVAGAKILDDAAHRIAVVVGSGDVGLADTRVDTRLLPMADGVVDVVFKVTEGVPVVINEVKIEGNEFTKDKVIRREILLGPGDGMLEDKAELSQRKLENLDYFSRVRYYLRQTDRGRDANGAEYRDLVYEVEEKRTGSFMVGVGASSVDSVYVSAEASQSNFDLFAPQKLFRGGGQKARLFAQCGPRIQTYELSINEPWLFDRMLDLTVDAYRRMRWYDDYDIIRSGASASLAYPIKVWNVARLWDENADPLVTFGRFGVRLSGEFVEFDDVDRGVWYYKGRDVSLRDEEHRYGDAFEPVIRVFWSRDKRDNFRIPRNGYRTQLFADIAPAGDNKYWKLGFTHRSYFQLWKNVHGPMRDFVKDHVLMIALRGETIDDISDDIPIYNRLFLGGPKSIRGIEYRNVSPMARKYNRDDDLTNSYLPWGGQTLFALNVEYTVPIVSMLRLAAFTDLGSVGADVFDLDMSDTFAWTAGVGIRLDIPMFPIRLDFAAPIEKPDHADKEVFSFTVGYDF